MPKEDEEDDDGHNMLITKCSCGSYIRISRLLCVKLTDNWTDLCGRNQ